MADSEETSSREYLSQFRWARGSNDDSQSSSASLGNPFSRLYNAILRSNEQSDEGRSALAGWARILGFILCLIGSIAFFSEAFFILPIIALSPATFALCFSFGSLLVMLGFSILLGFVDHFKHLISKERLPFTFAYFSSLALTLYFALTVQSYLGTLVFAIIQVVALVVYVFAYFPGGIQKLRSGSAIALRGAGSLLPT